MLRFRDGPLMLLSIMLCSPSLRAQAVDTAAAFRASAMALDALAPVRSWANGLRIHDMKVDYREGKDVEFWVEAVQNSFVTFDSALARFRRSPQLTALEDVVVDYRSIGANVSTLSERMSDCHSCDNATAKRLRDALGDVGLRASLSKAGFELDRVFSAALLRADAIVAVCREQVKIYPCRGT